MTQTERLKEKLTHLRLKGMRQQLDTTLAQATGKNLDVVATLNLLADIELEQRWQNAIFLRWRQSALKEKLTIDQFDFDHHQSRKEQKTRILNLLNLDFVSAHSEAIFIGNPVRVKPSWPNASPMRPAMPTSRCSLPPPLT